MDILQPPKATTTCHITDTCECPDCGKMTEAKAGTVRGMLPGSNLLWEKCTYEGAADSMENRYGIKFSKLTIQHALDAVATGPEHGGQPEGRRPHMV